MRTIAQRIRDGGQVADGEFDDVYPLEVSSISYRHWTPVAVATLAARWLTERGATRILDIGSGPGKFCIAGALSTGAHFAGVELRPNLVEAARAAAERFGADRASFFQANILDFDCNRFDGFYLYNPFQEQIEDNTFLVDPHIERSSALHKTYLAVTMAILIRAPIGTPVVTFNGFGSPMPPHYDRLGRDHVYGSELALWVRGTPSKTSL
jgi:SAM-dependent methyltransferase